MTFDLATLVQPATSKMLLVVLDGLAGFATAERGTELEEADTPNLDGLAAAGMTGLLDPVGPGITPGSGPAHLSLFGYDPFDYHLGRGALSAAGLDVHVLRLRRRLTPVGLAIRTVRSRGYLMEPAPG